MLKRLIPQWSSSCILCDGDGLLDMDICQFCLERLIKNTHCCYQCATPMPTTTTDKVLCGKCQTTPPDFQATFAPFIYQDIMRLLIPELKFNHQYKNARLLGQLLLQSLPLKALPECIIPVPLHKKRYRARGFNQSVEIAKNIGKRLKIPVDSSVCIRHKDTAHQIGLSIKARDKNVKGAFSIPNTILYSHIAILDDVMTTGSTLREIASVFKKAGVSRIDVWVCARASR